MPPRLAGAMLALIASALLALSIVTSAWWAGHPEVEGRTIDAKSVFVGLHGAEGCNTGGDGACTTLVFRHRERDCVVRPIGPRMCAGRGADEQRRRRAVLRA